MTAANVKFDSVALWIQIWGAPFDMSSPKVASEIGRRLGEVVEVEKRKSSDAQNLFMRVKVTVPLSKPLRWGGFIGGSNGQRSWVDFKYECLPLFCHFCGLLGHDLKHCANHFARSRNGDEMVYQYEEWLKAARGRPVSPLGRGSTTNLQPINEARIEAQVGNNSLEVPTAEYEITKENPTKEVSHAIGKNVKSGISTVCTERVSEIEGIIMESLGPPSSVSNIEVPSLY